MFERFYYTVAVLACVMVIIASGFYLQGSLEVQKVVDRFGAGFDDRSKITLFGSSSNLVSLPLEAVFSSATTTDAGGSLADGGFELTQDIDSSGIREINLNIQGIAGTATSSINIVQLGSFDGSNFFNIASSTDNIVATSTVPIFRKSLTYDPGLATTTDNGISIPFTVDGYIKTRFVIWADNLASDPTDGVQAWITATLVEDIAR